MKGLCGRLWFTVVLFKLQAPVGQQVAEVPTQRLSHWKALCGHTQLASNSQKSLSLCVASKLLNHWGLAEPTQ